MTYTYQRLNAELKELIGSCYITGYHSISGHSVTLLLPYAMPRALTVKSVEAIKPASTRQEIPDGGLPGLFLIVQPTGRKSWGLRYRFETRPRKLTFGRYPRIDLRKARELAREALQEIELGNDPATAKQAAKQERKSGQFRCENILDDYIERHIKVRNRTSTIKEFTRVINREFKPVWSGRDIRDVTRKDIINLLDGIATDGSSHVANQAYAILSRFFRFCMQRDILEMSPFTNIERPTKVQSRDRVLTDQEAGAFWHACERLGWPFGHAGKLLLLTGQRRGEVGESSWKEFDLEKKLWTIPAERAKNGIATDVHLSNLAISVLQSVPLIEGCDFVFSTTGTSPISGWSKAKAKYDREIVEQFGSPIPAWRIHDLRRTVASGMAALNIPPHVVEKILNHQTGRIQGVAAVYNRHEYRQERAEALDIWSSHIEAQICKFSPQLVHNGRETDHE